MSKLVKCPKCGRPITTIPVHSTVKKPFKIYLVDPGYARIIYKAKNPNNQVVYYAICQEAPDKFKLYRLDKSFEAQTVAVGRKPLKQLMEIPTGDSMLETDIRLYLLLGGNGK